MSSLVCTESKYKELGIVIDKKEFEKLSYRSATAKNVHCGTVNYQGALLSGCGALKETYSFFLELDEGVWTSRHYCIDCIKAAKKEQ